MPHLLRLFLLLLPAMALILPATAQDKPKPPRTCRILFLNGPASAPQKLHLFDGVSSQEVDLPRMNFSPVYQIHSDATALALLTETPAPAPKAGTPPSIPAGAPTATLTASMTDFYLILSSDPANKVAPVQIQVIHADAANFKDGQMLWYNLTDIKIAGILGSRKLLIEPKSRIILDAPAARMEDYGVNIRYLPPGKAQTEPLCETRWTHDPRSRSVVFILMPEGSLIPRIFGISDFRPNVNQNPNTAP